MPKRGWEEATHAATPVAIEGGERPNVKKEAQVEAVKPKPKRGELITEWDYSVGHDMLAEIASEAHKTESRSLERAEYAREQLEDAGKQPKFDTASMAHLRQTLEIFENQAIKSQVLKESIDQGLEALDRGEQPSPDFITTVNALMKERENDANAITMQMKSKNEEAGDVHFRGSQREARETILIQARILRDFLRKVEDHFKKRPDDGDIMTA